MSDAKSYEQQLNDLLDDLTVTFNKHVDQPGGLSNSVALDAMITLLVYSADQCGITCEELVRLVSGSIRRRFRNMEAS